MSEWVKSLSGVWLFVTLWTVACQAPLSIGFSRQGYWSGLAFLSPGDLPHPRIKPTSPVSPALQADFLPTEPLGKSNFYGFYQQLWNLKWDSLWSSKSPSIKSSHKYSSCALRKIFVHLALFVSAKHSKQPTDLSIVLWLIYVPDIQWKIIKQFKRIR